MMSIALLANSKSVKHSALPGVNYSIWLKFTTSYNFAAVYGRSVMRTPIHPTFVHLVHLALFLKRLQDDITISVPSNVHACLSVLRTSFWLCLIWFGQQRSSPQRYSRWREYLVYSVAFLSISCSPRTPWTKPTPVYSSVALSSLP